MKLLGFSIILLFFATHHGFAQYTQIPDTEFEIRLISQGIDTEGTLDGQVLTDDIDHITFLSVTTPFPETDPLINDLTGIEDFISLEDLRFASNNITSVDLNNIVNLRVLNCKFNNLVSLDLSNNVLLENLDATNCFEGTCDQENTISNLDLSNNVLLKTIFLNNYNILSELDLSNNPDLISVGVSRNTILNSLNLKNGNNLNLDIVQILDNPQLECITVDDPVAATEGVLPPYDDWDVEPGIIFSKDCILGIEEVVLFNQINLIPNPASDYFKIEAPSGIILGLIEVYDVASRKVIATPFENVPISFSGIRAGVYFVRINSSLGTITKRIIKE